MIQVRRQRSWGRPLDLEIIQPRNTMPTEIEAKIKLTPSDSDLTQRLAAAGAQPGPRVLEVNRYFDTPTGSLRRTDQGLRIRVEKDLDTHQEKVIITHKGQQLDSKLKRRSETELLVSDARAACALLEALGFTNTLSFEKRREKWSLKKCEVVVDTLPYLGTFVEIEGPSERTVQSVIKLLGLQYLPPIKTSYIALLHAYVTEKRITATNLRLKSR